MNLFVYKIKSRLRVCYLKVALALVGMFLPIIVAMHSEIKKELSVFAEGFSILLEVNPKLFVGFKMKNGKLVLCKGKISNYDLAISFKNVYSAFLVFTLQCSLEAAVAEHRVSTKGNTADSMVLIRCFGKILSYIPMKRG